MTSGQESISTHQKTVFNLLQKRAGLIFPDSRLNEVKGFMNQAAQSAQLSLEDYSRRLSHDNGMFDDLCNLVTIAETYFFRDPKQFDFVRQVIIPAWIKKSLSCDRPEPIHVLSAGCSTGEEPYSLAILFDQEGLGPTTKISAGDICKRSLSAAAVANYGPWALRTSDNIFRNLHFDTQDSRFILREKYRSRVQFSHLNLLDDISRFSALGLANLDLIFCRNVLIYFDLDSITQVVRTLHSLLKPGGYLILGPSDPSAAQFANFEVVVSDFGVFYTKLTGEMSQAKFPQVGTETSGNEQSRQAAGQQGSQKSGHQSTHSSSHQAGHHSAHGANHQGGHQGKRSSARKHQGEINRLPPVTATPESAEKLLTQADAAFGRGQYEIAFSITGTILDDARAAVLHIKALANFKGSDQAEKILKKLIGQHASSFELQYLHGHLLMDLGQGVEATAALKRCLFLDPRAAMAHFTLALVQKSLKDREGAQKSFRNAIELCKDLPPDQALPYSDGELARSVTATATNELIALSQW